MAACIWIDRPQPGMPFSTNYLIYPEGVDCAARNGIDGNPVEGSYLLNKNEIDLFQQIAGPYDYAHAAQIWAFFFAFTVGLWLVSRCAGTVIEAVRRY